jgi:hypothetical protein
MRTTPAVGGAKRAGMDLEQRDGEKSERQTEIKATF